MRTLKRQTLVTAIVLTGLSFVSNAGNTSTAPTPRSFHGSARVDVDPQGKVLSIEASKDLPEAVRVYIHQQLAKWTYKRNAAGMAQGTATTWVNLRACAVPTASGAYSMGLGYYGNGPLVTSMGPAGNIGRLQLEGKVLSHLIVGEDGGVSLDSIEGGPRNLGMKSQFANALRDWLATLRVQPELIDGKPVRARATMPLELQHPRRRGRSTQDEASAQVLESPECKQAGVAMFTDGKMSLPPVDEDRMVLVQPVF